MQFITGALMMGYAISSLFFIRFWVRTKDRLFAIFSLAMGLLALERLCLELYEFGDETRSYVYLIRLSAYLLIIFGIVDKNRRP